MNIVIVGTGYVGLVTGVGFAEQGHRVSFVDLDSKKIDRYIVSTDSEEIAKISKFLT